MKGKTREMLNNRSIFCCAMLLVFGFGLINSAFSAVPIVNVKVAEYPTSCEFSSLGGAAWHLGGKSGRLGAGELCSIVGKLLQQAKIKYHVMVESVAMRDADKVAAAMSRWKATGRPIHTMQLGKINYGKDGKTALYDGRVLFIGVGEFMESDPAQKMVDELAGLGSSSWILEDVLQPAMGNISLRSKGKELANGTGELQIQPAMTLKFQKVEIARGYSWHGFAERTFRGDMTIKWGARNALDCVLKSDLEAILASVVPSEISAKAAPGALQAQSVAARGEILSKIGLRHLHEGFDFCSEQHCQVFSGETGESIRMAQIISPTRGFLLRDKDGAIVDAVYAANCGGHSEANHLVWTSPPDPILAGFWDTPAPLKVDLRNEAQVRDYILNPPKCYCSDPTVEGGDKYRWAKHLGTSEWAEVEKKGAVGRIKEVKDITRGISGRIYRLTLVGEKGTRTLMKELGIRQLFGGLRSSCFVVAWKRDRDGFMNSADFQGAGWGHGVGMCQSGAQSMAKQGVGCETILKHYFPGSRLERVY